jgi:hypothetical protein
MNWLFHRYFCPGTAFALSQYQQPLDRTQKGNEVMNAVHTETRLNQFVARLLQSAASEVKVPSKPDAHTLALAFRAAFSATRTS